MCVCVALYWKDMAVYQTRVEVGLYHCKICVVLELCSYEEPSVSDISASLELESLLKSILSLNFNQLRLHWICP